MGQTVRDLRDLPLLYVEEEKKMGAPKKTRAELLDKVIQFIYDYQKKHNGETPALNVVEKHVGISGSAGGYYIAILVDDGRLDRIGTRPFRVTINETNRLNQRAIKAWERIQERIERSDAAERDRIRAEQAEGRVTEQRDTDHSTALSLVGAPDVSDTVVAEVRPKTDVRPATEPAPMRMPIAESWDRQVRAGPEQDPEAAKIVRFNDARGEMRAATRDVKAMLPQMLRHADDRDLVFELLSRGYRVDKVR